MALTKISNNSLSAISTLPASIPTGALTLLSTQTASSSASISFTSGIDSTYSSYVFKFINIHAGTDATHFQFNLSTDGGSNYNVTKTTTMFRAFHTEADSSASLSYATGRDLAQSTADQQISWDLGALNDENLNGTLQLYNPSSDTFVKHYISNTSNSHKDEAELNAYTAGYGNTVSPVNAISFKMSSGNIDDGIIKMYGVS